MKERILFLTAYVPHKAAAGEKNTMIMLNDLANDYDVDLIYYKYDYENDYIPERENVKVVMKRKNSIMIKLKNFTLYPFLHPIFSIRFDWFVLFKIRRLLRENRYKAVILNHSGVFIYGKYLDSTIPRILLCHDVMAQRVIRSSSSIMQKLCIYSEGFSLKQPNAYIFSFSQKDCELIKQNYKKDANICLDYIDEQILVKKPDVINDYFVLFGDWRRKENSIGALWLLNNVGPLLKSTITVKIIGRDFPGEQVVHSPKINIEILGFVDDPYGIIAQSKALISPLFKGAGIKVKVIESLACGTPVIGTDIAFEGLPTEFGNFMLLANTPKDYVDRIESINMCIEDRIKTRNEFIKAYQSESITNVISRL